jgi:hypothetical protein
MCIEDADSHLANSGGLEFHVPPLPWGGRDVARWLNDPPLGIKWLPESGHQDSLSKGFDGWVQQYRDSHSRIDSAICGSFGRLPVLCLASKSATKSESRSSRANREFSVRRSRKRMPSR